MGTKAKWRGSVLDFYDSSTHETTKRMAPLAYYDDFFGPSLVVPAAGASESGMDWVKKIVGAAPPTVAGIADQAGGIVECALTVDAQKQDAGLYMDDNRSFDVTKGLVFEARAKVNVLPTLVAETVIGLIGDWADGPDAITYSMFFTHDGSGEVFCEMDDNATDRSATSGVTATNTQTKIYRIDCTNIADVRFYIDGVDVTPSTAQAYAATGANAILQPYIGLYKASGAGLGKVQVDYVKIWQNRV